MATPHSTYTEDTEQQSKASLSNNGLLFLLRGSLCNYESIKTACRARNWLVERKGSALLISNLTTLERFLWVCWYFVYIVNGWVSSAATITRWTLYSRQTDCREPSRSHEYQFVSHNDVINSLLVHFFAVYIFAEAGLSAKIVKICTQQKFPAIR